MTVIHANPGVARWHGPRGYWRPAPGARKVFVGDFRAQNPARTPRWESKVTWAARLFVGCNVGDVPTWTLDHVVKFVKKHYSRPSRPGDSYKGASFVAQRGLWPSEKKKGRRLIEEDSIQVILINTDPKTSTKAFQNQAFDLAQLAARVFDQDQVILEFQRNGITVKTMGVGQ